MFSLSPKEFLRANIVDDAKKGNDWNAQVAFFALQHLHSKPLMGPIKLEILFVMPRPKKHFGTAKKAAKLKSTAPHWCDGGQSAALTKLVRSTEDALTNIAWKDDKQVAVQILEKVYGKKPGAFIKIAPLREVDSGTNGIDRRPLRQENQEGRNLFGWQDPGRKGPGVQE